MANAKKFYDVVRTIPAIEEDGCIIKKATIGEEYFFLASNKYGQAAVHSFVIGGVKLLETEWGLQEIDGEGVEFLSERLVGDWGLPRKRVLRLIKSEHPDFSIKEAEKRLCF